LLEQLEFDSKLAVVPIRLQVHIFFGFISV
jgi:hypothetical protein